VLQPAAAEAVEAVSSVLLPKVVEAVPLATTLVHVISNPHADYGSKISSLAGVVPYIATDLVPPMMEVLGKVAAVTDGDKAEQASETAAEGREATQSINVSNSTPARSPESDSETWKLVERDPAAVPFIIDGGVIQPTARQSLLGKATVKLSNAIRPKTNGLSTATAIAQAAHTAITSASSSDHCQVERPGSPGDFETASPVLNMAGNKTMMDGDESTASNTTSCDDQRASSRGETTSSRDSENVPGDEEKASQDAAEGDADGAKLSEIDLGCVDLIDGAEDTPYTAQLPTIDLFPQHCSSQLHELLGICEQLTDSVHQAGFANSQEAYNRAEETVWAILEDIELGLASSKALCPANRFLLDHCFASFGPATHLPLTKQESSVSVRAAEATAAFSASAAAAYASLHDPGAAATTAVAVGVAGASAALYMGSGGRRQATEKSQGREGVSSPSLYTGDVQLTVTAVDVNLYTLLVRFDAIYGEPH
jgi:hypothetical protein